MNRTETARLLQEMTERWPAWRLPTGGHLASLVATWATDLGAVPYPSAVEAVRSAGLDGREWPPALGWVVVEGLRRSGVVLPPDADEAWLEVQQALSGVGRYGSPVWSHPALGEVVGAMGGWRSLCGSEDTMADRAHFLRLWPVARQRAIVEACTRPAEYCAAIAAAADVALEAADPLAELDGPSGVPAKGRASQEEALAAVRASREAFRAAAPHPNRKRARNEP